MNPEVIYAALLAVIVILALGWFFEAKSRGQYQKWLYDERLAHDKSRHAMREAAARMRRENRERLLGIIEEQRGA